MSNQQDPVREALRLAIRQNSHDMLMTGEEIRQCEQALATPTASGDMVSVPREPTQDMLAAAMFMAPSQVNKSYVTKARMEGIWGRMLAAAPVAVPVGPVAGDGWTPPKPVIFEFDKKKPKPDQYAAYTVTQLHDAYRAGAALARPASAQPEGRRTPHEEAFRCHCNECALRRG